MGTGFNPDHTESQIPALQFGLLSQASMLTSRREVYVAAGPGTYAPGSSRLLRFHVADGSSGWQLGTTKFAFGLKNTDPRREYSRNLAISSKMGNFGAHSRI